MSIVYRNRLKSIKAEVAGKKKCQLAAKAVVEMDKIIEKEVAAILKAAFLHTQSRKQITIKAVDLKLGFDDYRASFMVDLVDQFAAEFNNFVTEIKNRIGDKNDDRNGYLESVSQKE